MFWPFFSPLALCLWLTACTGSAPATAPKPTAAPQQLSALHWCNQRSLVLTDDSSAVNLTPVPNAPALGPANGTPVALSDWHIFEANLGFTVFLPKSLPGGTCLLDAFGSLRNPVYGSNFTITYKFPDQTSLTIAQAPERSQNTTFQCSASSENTAAGAKGGTPTTTSTATAAPLQLCTGVRNTTNITFSARWSTSALQQFFQQLQPDVNWLPAS